MNTVVLKTTLDGFVTGDDVKFLREVAEALSRLAPSHGADVAHTGGGNFAVRMPLDGGASALYGYCDGIWATDIVEANGDLRDSSVIQVPQNLCLSPEGVAPLLHARFLEAVA